MGHRAWPSGKMFQEAAPVGKLDMQLVHYRGLECKASQWVSNGDRPAELMNKIDCIAGETQIGRVLKHTLNEHERGAVRRIRRSNRSPRRPGRPAWGAGRIDLYLSGGPRRSRPGRLSDVGITIKRQVLRI